MPSSSTAASLFLPFTDRLERLGLRYTAKGSVEGILYGEPRESYREGSSPKHLDDIRAMLRVSGDQNDHELLKRQIAQIASRGLDQPWGAVLAERPARW